MASTGVLGCQLIKLSEKVETSNHQNSLLCLNAA